MTSTRRRISLAPLLLIAMTGAAARADALGDAYRTVIIGADNEKAITSPLAAVAATYSARTTETCDIVAEFLWRNEARKLHWNAAGLHAMRILTFCPGSGRYWNVVEAAHRSTKAFGAPEQYQQYRTMNPHAGAEQYVPGSVDLDGLRQAQRRASAVRQPTPEQARVLADLPSNTTMDDMIAHAGPPTNVGMLGIRINDVISVEVRQLWFYYRGIGRVTFDWQRDSGWHLNALVADPMAFEDFMPYRPLAAELGLPDAAHVALIQLMTGHASSIKASAQSQYRAEAASPEYLDTAAEVLLKNHVAIANTGATDAYAWLCNVLAHQGGKRYAAVLASVAASTDDEKLRRFAKQSIDKPRDANPQPYVPGSISLDEQAKRYPSLYPQIDLVRGLL